MLINIDRTTYYLNFELVGDIVEDLDYWRLCEEFNVIQAALLIVGYDPSKFQDTIHELESDERPQGYDAAFAALFNAINSNTLPATKRNAIDGVWDDGLERMVDVEIDEIDCEKTTISFKNLRAWLSNRGFSSGFFFGQTAGSPEYLNPDHPRYAPKLAAAVNAWLALDDAEIEGRSPKQALTRWLREHAVNYNLSDDDGKPNETGIEECAKIANWQTKGGAPKTPNS